MQRSTGGLPRLAHAAMIVAAMLAGTGGEPVAAPQPVTGAARVGLFRAPGFPTVDAAPIDPAVLDAALADLPVVTFDSPAALRQGLTRETAAVLMLPYGSAFPVDAWPAIRAFVKGGGGLVVLGGAPFAVPVRQVSGAAGAATYVQDRRQPTFSHEFLIGPAEPVDRRDILSPARVEAVRGSEWNRLPPEPERAFALTIRLATIKDLKDEGGSEGFRDAVIRPLVHVLDRDGIPRAAPLIAIDRLRGPDAGARWVLAPSDAALEAPTIHDLALRAIEGAAAVDARPVRASVEPGTTPMLRINVQRPVPREGEPIAAAARIRVTDKSGADVWSGNVPLNGPAAFRTGLAPIGGGATLAPGFYRVEITIDGVSWHPQTTTTGFWVRDEQLLAGGSRLTVSRDWIRQDGRVMPVVGTTYMAADVDRKFLFEPNPYAWDRDFAEMQRLGINFVRTGLWTAWSRVMLNAGAIDEGVVSALDAYVQTAASHGIHVCFTFFAFQPPAFGGTNPFLDPRALDGQRALLTLLASRFHGVPWVHWDLINEPSYAPPDKLWTNQPVGDANEARAWEAWLRARHGDDDGALRVLWRVPGEDVRAIPELRDLSWAMIREGRVPRKAYDFSLFSQDVVARWAGTLRDVLKAAGGDQLVTLGQDEGGTDVRPAQQLHADSLDYTAVHTWWNNDDLLWDGVMTKVPEKPNLHQETGMMRLEDTDGRPWRTPEDAARLLERKLAYAFAARGAGVVQWAWNINPYQPIDNESVIGLFRPDGTAKPELRSLRELAAFFTKAAPHLEDFEPDPVVLVIPHARLFSGRPGGLDATKRIVHLLAERFGIVPTALSDQRLTAARLAGARLVIVPDPEVLDEPAATALHDAANRALVLITGNVEGDPYGRTTDALKALDVVDQGRPVVQHERTRWGGGWATYDGRQSEWLRRSTRPETDAPPKGIWLEPIPVAFAREQAPLAALLKTALAAAHIHTSESDVPVTARVLLAPRAALVVCVNETADDLVRTVNVEGRAFEIPVAAGRSRLALIERGTGNVIAATTGKGIEPSR